MLQNYNALSTDGQDSSEAHSNSDSSSGPWPRFEKAFHVHIDIDQDDASQSSYNHCSESESMRTAATAQTMDAAAKGVMHSASAFLGPALIHAAAISAAKLQGCSISTAGTTSSFHNNNGDNADCILSTEQAETLRVFGSIRASSILTVSSIVSTVSASLFLPVLGAIIDRTPHRKTVGAWTSYGLVVVNVLQIFVSETNWPVFVLTYTLHDFLNVLHHAIVLAYLQNLTPNITQLSQYTAKFAMVQFLTMIFYMLSMVLYSKATSANDFEANRMAHVISGSFGLIVLVYAWRFLFAAVPARRNAGDSLQLNHASVCRDSWKGLFQTIRSIRKNYKALQWLLFTLLWSPSLGSGSYFSIFSTLHKSLMQMSSAEIGLVNLFTLMSTVAGAKLASLLASRLNPLKSFQLCLLCLALNNACTALFVHGHDQLHLYLGFQCLLGACFGWLLPTERVLICSLAPLGQEAELMGLVIAVHTAAAWVPPFLFSILNEAGYSLRVALAAQDVLLISALVSTIGIGVFEQAVTHARSDRTERDDLRPRL